MKIALATSPRFHALDSDLPLLLDAARARGHEAELRDWRDPDVDWAAHDVTVVRSCWDYVQHRDAFLAWAASVPRLANPADVIAWNTDKTYLRELAGAGVPVIETHWDLTDAATLGADVEWVVKPTVSSGSRDTARWATPAEAAEHSRSLLALGRPTMTQPYVASVDDEGETAMLHLGGRFSHAIRKGPLLARGEGVRQDRDSRGDITPREPSAAQREVASAALAAVPGDPDLLYARVDLVTGADGSPLVIELELAEPSVFLPWADGAADRFVDAIERRA